MPLSSFKKLILGFLLLSGQSGYAENSIVKYEKAFLSKDKVDLSAIISRNYLEIRWDSDGDGIIDTWNFSKNGISVSQHFLGGRLAAVSVEQVRKTHTIWLTYHADSKFKMELTTVQIFPHQVYFDEESSGLANRFGKKKDSCAKQPISKVLDGSAWESFLCKTNELERQQRLKQSLSESCQKLPEKTKQELLAGANLTYGVKYEGFVEDNEILNCLAKSPKTKTLFPSFLSKITDVQSSSSMKIECVKSNEPGCGQASYNSSVPPVLNVPVTDPLCQPDMTQVFGKQIFHESLHRTSPKGLTEQSIQNIVKGCMLGDVAALDKVQFQVGAGGKSGTFDSPQLIAASNREAIAANPPADTRNLAAQPGTLIATAGSSDGALNSAFRSIASASQQAFNPNQAYRESVQRTAPSFAIFEAAVNKFVPPASAASAQWLNSSIPSNSGAGVAVQAPDLSGPKRSPSSDSSTSSAPTQKKAAPQAASREVANAKTGSTDSRATSAGSQSNLGFSSKGTSSDPDETSAASSAPTLSPQQQKVVTEIIQAVNGAKSPSEAKALLKKYSPRLLRLKVHVLDPEAPKNEKVYGLPSADGAAQQFSLIKGKLVSE